jgi:hypothetical protein
MRKIIQISTSSTSSPSHQFAIVRTRIDAAIAEVKP